MIEEVDSRVKYKDEIIENMLSGKIDRDVESGEYTFSSINFSVSNYDYLVVILLRNGSIYILYLKRGKV